MRYFVRGPLGGPPYFGPWTMQEILDAITREDLEMPCELLAAEGRTAGDLDEVTGWQPLPPEFIPSRKSPSIPRPMSSSAPPSTAEIDVSHEREYPALQMVAVALRVLGWVWFIVSLFVGFVYAVIFKAENMWASSVMALMTGILSGTTSLLTAWGSGELIRMAVFASQDLYAVRRRLEAAAEASRGSTRR